MCIERLDQLLPDQLRKPKKNNRFSGLFWKIFFRSLSQNLCLFSMLLGQLLAINFSFNPHIIRFSIGVKSGKSDPNSFICAWKCKSSCTFHHHTARCQQDPRTTLESWQTTCSLLIKKLQKIIPIYDFKREENNYSVNSEFISKRMGKKVKNILLGWFF